MLLRNFSWLSALCTWLTELDLFFFLLLQVCYWQKFTCCLSSKQDRSYLPLPILWSIYIYIWLNCLNLQRELTQSFKLTDRARHLRVLLWPSIYLRLSTMAPSLYQASLPGLHGCILPSNIRIILLVLCMLFSLPVKTAGLCTLAIILSGQCI